MVDKKMKIEFFEVDAGDSIEMPLTFLQNKYKTFYYENDKVLSTTESYLKVPLTIKVIDDLKIKVLQSLFTEKNPIVVVLKNKNGMHGLFITSE